MPHPRQDLRPTFGPEGPSLCIYPSMSPAYIRPHPPELRLHAPRDVRKLADLANGLEVLHIGIARLPIHVQAISSSQQSPVLLAEPVASSATRQETHQA